MTTLEFCLAIVSHVRTLYPEFFMVAKANHASRGLTPDAFVRSLGSGTLSPHPGPGDETPQKSTELTRKRYQSMG